MARAPELPALGRGGTPGLHGPKAPSQGWGRRGGGSWGCARRLARPLRTALRAGRSRRSGWAGRASSEANPPHTGAATESGAPRAVFRAARGPAAAGCEGVGRASAETFAPLQTRPSWRKKARLAPKASESVAVGLRCPRHSHPRRRGAFTLTHTLPQHARGWGGAATEPRSLHAGSVRRGGTAFPAPSRGPPARRHTSARSRAPPAGPLGAPRSPGQLPGASGDGEKGHKAKEAAKKRRRRSRGQGPVDSPGEGRGNTEGAAKAPGLARGLRAQPPRAAPLPSPSRALGSLSEQFLPPPLRPSPLRRGTQSRGLKERREGKREGREGAEEKGGRSLQRRVLSFSSGPSGQTARPLPGRLRGAFSSLCRGGPPGGLVLFLLGASLTPPRPRSALPAPRLGLASLS